MRNLSKMSERQKISSLSYKERTYLIKTFDIYKGQIRAFQSGKGDNYGVGYKLTWNGSYNLNYEFEKFVKNSYKSDSKIIFSDSFKTFLYDNQDKKVFRFLLKGSHFANVSKCNYITLRKGEKLTFHPRPQNQMFNDNKDWKREGRQEIKPLALLILLFGSSVKKYFSNNDIEIATNAIKSYESEPLSYVSTFEEIYEINTNDWAQSSCMQGKGYLHMYENNKDVFTPIVWKSGTQIIGRCLLVKTDNITFYDRLYYKNSEHYQSIVDAIIKEDKYYYKTSNSAGNNSFTFRGETVHKNVCVSVSIDVNENMPYMDTMRYYDSDSETLQNYEPCEGYFFNDTCGGYEEITSKAWDEIDQCYIDNDDCVCIDFGYMEGSHTHIDNCYFSDRNQGYCLR